MEIERARLEQRDQGRGRSGAPGVIYAATGARCLHELRRAAPALKAVMPDVAICVFVDSANAKAIKGDPLLNSIFNRIEVLEAPRYNWDDKLYAIENSPFERTIYLDVDTLVIGNISGLFGVLDEFDFCFTLSEGKHELDWETEVYPEAIREFNTGVVGFSLPLEERRAFVELWRSLRKAHPEGHDQPTFRSAIIKSRSRFCALASEYNFRSDIAQYCDMPVKIIHSHNAIDMHPTYFDGMCQSLNERRWERRIWEPRSFTTLGSSTPHAAATLLPTLAGSKSNSAVLFRQSQNFRAVGDIKASFSALEAAVASEPPCVPAYLALLDHMSGEGDESEALELGLRLYQRVQLDLPLGHYLGKALSRVGRLEEAAALLRELATAHDRHEWVQDTASRALEANGESQDAAHFAARFALLRPTDITAQLRAARLLTRAGEVRAAVPILERAHEIDPANGEIFETFWRINETIGDTSRAAELLRKRASANPGELSYRHELGKLLIRSGDPQGAVEALSDANTLAPTHSWVRHDLALALEAVGRESDALQTIEPVLPELLQYDAVKKLVQRLNGLVVDSRGKGVAFRYPSWTEILAGPNFIINLDRRPDRWLSASNNAASAGIIAPVRWAAVDAQNDGLKEEWLKHGNPRFETADSDFWDHKGTQGCCLSHLNIWKHIIEKEIPYATVFEDDIDFHEDYGRLAPLFYDATPQDWDILYLGSHIYDEVPRDSAVIESPLPNMEQADIVRLRLYCTHGYVITLDGARKLYNAVLARKEGVRPIDRMIFTIMNQSNWGYAPHLRWYAWRSHRFPSRFEHAQTWTYQRRNDGLVFQCETFGTDIKVHG